MSELDLDLSLTQLCLFLFLNCAQTSLYPLRAKSLQWCLILTSRFLCPWGFSRQEYWSGLPCPLPGDLPDLGIEPTALMPPELACGFFTARPPRNPCYHHHLIQLLVNIFHFAFLLLISSPADHFPCRVTIVR